MATERFDCAICLEPLHEDEPITSLKCKHRYHHACIGEWLIGKPAPTCPTCRGKVKQHAPKQKRAKKARAVAVMTTVATRCPFLLTRGPRKSEECGATVQLGKTYCPKHHLYSLLVNDKGRTSVKAEWAAKAVAINTANDRQRSYDVLYGWEQNRIAWERSI